jgi:hypothetical protein
VAVVKVRDLPARRGMRVPDARCTASVPRSWVTGGRRAGCGWPTRTGGELQVDFGRIGPIPDPGRGRRRLAWALILTAVCSGHRFVWLSQRGTIAKVIAGGDAA